MPSPRFLRSARRLRKLRPDSDAALRAALATLSDDAFAPMLRSHKLKGELSGLWSCSAGYDLRILFEIVVRDGAEVLALHAVGTHDEVY